MARYTHEQAAQAVAEALQAAGGTMSHNELVSALENNGQGQAVQHLVTLQNNKQINAMVVAQPDNVPELRYTLGGE